MIEFEVDTNDKEIEFEVETGIPEIVVAKLQTKTVTPTNKEQTVVPDRDYDGLDKVIVNPAELDSSELEERITNLENKQTFSNSIVLPQTRWIKEQNSFYQQVEIEGTTEYSKIDLQPTPEIFVYLQNNNITLTSTNENGEIKIWALDNKPNRDLEMQVTITEIKI